MRRKFHLENGLLILFLSIIIAFLCYYFQAPFKWNTGILSASITLGSILCGFDAVHKNTLLTIDSVLMKSIRTSKFLTLILAFMRDFSYIAIIFVITSIAYIVLFCSDFSSAYCGLESPNLPAYIYPLALALWIFLLLYMLRLFLYIHRLFDLIIEKGGQAETPLKDFDNNIPPNE